VSHRDSHARPLAKQTRIEWTHILANSFEAWRKTLASAILLLYRNKLQIMIFLCLPYPMRLALLRRASLGNAQADKKTDPLKDLEGVYTVIDCASTIVFLHKYNLIHLDPLGTFRNGSINKDRKELSNNENS
jgi:hypothetical protein